MPIDRNARVSGILASAVADDGTFTVSYPSGTSQGSFLNGLDGSNSYIVLNGNDKWTVADPGISLAFGASLITVTNLSGYSWPAGTTYELNLDMEDGNELVFLTFPLPLLAAIANGDVMTECRPGIDGTIEHWWFTTTAAVTTASRAATLNLEIGTTNVTGGTIALTSAAATPIGKVIEGSAITGANRLTPESLLSIEASSVTAFAEGSGYVTLRIRKTPAASA